MTKSKLYQRLANSTRELSLSNYIFHVFLLLMLCASCGSIISNLFTGFPMIANLKWVLAMGMCGYGFYIVHRKKQYVESFKFLLFLATLLFIILPSWFYGGGDNTVTILYLMLISIEAFLMFENSILRWLFTAMSGCFCVLLLYITYEFPWLIQHTSVQNVLVDTLIQITITFGIITTSISIYTKRYLQQHQMLTEANIQLEKLASVDVLTGLYTRRKFLELLDALLKDTKIPNFYLIMVDIDCFKSINDTYGHLVGDCAIRHIALHLADVVGSKGYVGRYGGDEFIAIVLNKTDETIEELAKQLEDVPHFNNEPIHISAGIAKWADGSLADALIKQADELLMAAKKQGKNQVCRWNTQPAQQVNG